MVFRIDGNEQSLHFGILSVTRVPPRALCVLVNIYNFNYFLFYFSLILREVIIMVQSMDVNFEIDFGFNVDFQYMLREYESPEVVSP